MTDWKKPHWWILPTLENRRHLNAIAVALDRWQAREPGATVQLRTGPVVIDGYSPCFRMVHFHCAGTAPEATPTRAWRATFNELVSP